MKEYNIPPKIEGVSLKKVEYSLDGGFICFTGSSFILPNNNFNFKFRVTDSTGLTTNFTVKNGTNVTKVN